MEIRIRLIYLIKSLVNKGINEAECSTEAAQILFESCECALEEAVNKFTMWTSVADCLHENYVAKMVAILKVFKLRNNFFKNQELVQISIQYESVYLFIKYLNIIMRNRVILIGRLLQFIKR